MLDARIDLHRCDREINELEEVMRESPPEPGHILLYGSSTMTNWRADRMCYEQLAPLRITNHGFGGSTAEEALYYYHRLVLPVRPKIMVYYEGPNDVAKGYTPGDVIALTHRLFEWARQDMSGIRFVIIPVKMCPALERMQDALKRCNELFAAYVQQHEDTSIIDVSSLACDAKGTWRTDIYNDDLLHHNRKGYEELAALLRPALEAWSAE